jgi:hypothetical protein
MRATPKARQPKPVDEIDSLASMVAELAECVEILRPHYPRKPDAWLHSRALSMRDERWRVGRWPSPEELAARAKGGG